MIINFVIGYVCGMVTWWIIFAINDFYTDEQKRKEEGK